MINIHFNISKLVLCTFIYHDDVNDAILKADIEHVCVQRQKGFAFDETSSVYFFKTEAGDTFCNILPNSLKK